GTQEDPYCTIQSGLDAAGNGDTVEVAPGTYLENLVFPTDPDIILISSTGPEVTIIDGSAAAAPTIKLWATNQTNATVINGFTITGGSGWMPGNGGGGLLLYQASPTVSNNLIKGNNSVGHGGGVYSRENSAILTNNLIMDNTAASGSVGGGIFLQENTGLTARGCTITNNSAGVAGDGVFVLATIVPVLIDNSIIYGNGLSGDDNEIYIQSNGEVTIRHSLVEGGLSGIHVGGSIPVDWDETTNLDVDPEFVDPENGNYHVELCSPVVDMGDPEYVPAKDETDIDGEPRLMDLAVDIGSDEVDRSALPDSNENGIPDECECLADLSGDGAVEAFDLAILLGAWGPCPDPCKPGDPADTCAADLSGDCGVEAFDLAILLGAWGPCS
ncbi:MAG: right-handed parallel beta-helix repeat-containing protein, partial [Phycisphaerae bacterium]